MERTVGTTIEENRIAKIAQLTEPMWKTSVKYGVRSPKFIWAPCAVPAIFIG